MGTDWYQKGDGIVDKITEIDLGKNIVKIIHQVLKEKNMSITDMAESLNTNRRSINLFLSRLEEGKGGSLKTICKYANAININPYELFYESKLVPRKKRQS